jgi:hypothetical protein
MLRNFLIYFCSFSAAVPGGAGSSYLLLEAADRAGFQKQYPAAHQKLVNFLNYLIYILVEYAIPYLLFCALVALLWTLIIAEPKAQSKRKFNNRRLNHRS